MLSTNVTSGNSIEGHEASTKTNYTFCAKKEYQKLMNAYFTFAWEFKHSSNLTRPGLAYFSSIAFTGFLASLPKAF